MSDQIRIEAEAGELINDFAKRLSLLAYEKRIKVTGIINEMRLYADLIPFLYECNDEKVKQAILECQTEGIVRSYHYFQNGFRKGREFESSKKWKVG